MTRFSSLCQRFSVAVSVLSRRSSSSSRFLSSSSSSSSSKTKKKYNRKPGQGGSSEEYYIAGAIRRIKELHPRVVIEVVNACMVDVASNLFPARSIVQNAQVVIKVLTRADLLSDPALRYQIARVEAAHPNAAVVALDLQDTEKTKEKTLRRVREMVLGATRLASIQTAVVCGLPNAGKSSFVLPLTKSRTLKTKKKGSFHLPKVSPTAGWTLSTKRHVFEVKDQGIVALVDTPGLRPRINTLDVDAMAYLLAAGAMEPTTGMVDEELKGTILAMLLEALNRHAALTSEAPPYVQAFGLDGPTNDPTEFFQAYHKSLKKKEVQVLELVRTCRAGTLGGLIFERPETTMRETRRVHQYSDNQDNNLLQINRGSPIVCINDAAQRLIDIGTGKIEFTPLPEPPTSLKKETVPVLEDEPLPHETTTALPLDDATSDKPVPRKVVRLPPHQWQFKCAKCAGFVKVASSATGGGWCGLRHTRAINWKDDDIRAYFSRMYEAFGGNKHMKYLFKDSMACTFAAKLKKRSRRQAYKALGKNLGGSGFPVPNEERPRRFQSNQPIPLEFECQRRKNSCQREEGTVPKHVQKINKVRRKDNKARREKN